MIPAVLPAAPTMPADAPSGQADRDSDFDVVLHAVHGRGHGTERDHRRTEREIETETDGERSDAEDGDATAAGAVAAAVLADRIAELVARLTGQAATEGEGETTVEVTVEAAVETDADVERSEAQGGDAMATDMEPTSDAEIPTTTIEITASADGADDALAAEVDVDVARIDGPSTEPSAEGAEGETAEPSLPTTPDATAGEQGDEDSPSTARRQPHPPAPATPARGSEPPGLDVAASVGGAVGGARAARAESVASGPGLHGAGDLPVADPTPEPTTAAPTPGHAPPTPTTAAAPVAAAPAAPPPAAPALADQLVEHVSPLLEGPDGVHEMTLELRPAELGRVVVEVTLEDGRVSMRVHADELVSRKLLDDALPQLRTALERAGVRAGSLDVRDGSAPHSHGDGGRSSRDHRRSDGGSAPATVPARPGASRRQNPTDAALDVLL